jgi:hypothetical protein
MKPASLNVRFVPNATELLRCREMSRNANNGPSDVGATRLPIDPFIRRSHLPFNVLWTQPMNSLAIGLGMRLLNVTTPTGRG